MSNTKRIEAELAADRDLLRAQLNTFKADFAPAELVGRATSVLGGLGDGAVATARRNPGPLAVTGAGLAWMAVKAVARTTGPRASYDDTPKATAPGLSQPAPPMQGFDARVVAADQAMKADETGLYQKGDTSMTDTKTTPLSHAKERLYETTEGLRARLDEGLDGLPDGAKDRIRQAREAAISVQARAEAEAARAAQAARTTAHDNPLLVGGLALAVGAALAMLLPRTQVEDRTIGAHRDRLFDEADRIFREEKAKLQGAAEEMVAEGQRRVKETLASDDEAAQDHAA